MFKKVQESSVPGGDDAAPKGDNPGQRVLALPADPVPLNRGAAAGPSGAQALEVEPAFGVVLLEDGEGFGGGGHGGGSRPIRSFCHPP